MSVFNLQYPPKTLPNCVQYQDDGNNSRQGHW